MKPYKNLQEVFDLAYLGMAKQDWLPAYNSGSCQYLTSDGKRCAIGHAIPDDFITKMPFQGSITALRYDAVVITPENADLMGYTPYNGQIEYATDKVYFHDADKVKAFGEVKSLFANVNNKALESLQSCHDSPAINDYTAAPRMIKDNFHTFALAHDLTIPDSPLNIPTV